MGKYIDILERIRSKITESEQRHCRIYKAKDKKWYLELADMEHGQERDSTTYGPFESEDKLTEYMRERFTNPGFLNIDRSGKKSVPKKSPNGRPVKKPEYNRWWH